MPECHCNESSRHLWERAGPVIVYQGHFALLLVSLLNKHFYLCSKDPLPIRGHDTRTAAITECTTLARLLNAPMHENWDVSLPACIFPDTGEMLNSV